MIPHGVEVFLSVSPIDLRWGFNRLAGAVAEKIGCDVRCGALFLFVGKNRNALKVLFYDGTGLCLFYKRLDKGSFRLPDVRQDVNVTSVQIDERELEALLDGVDVQLKEEEQTEQKPRTRGKKSKILH